MNLILAKKEFEKYVNKYDLNDWNLDRKLNHTFRVVKISRDIAIELGLSEEKIKIAEFIGLFHDIARFKQYTEYGTFNDNKSFDHGNYSAMILEENNYLNEFTSNEKYKKIIKNAIINHNKYKIDDTLSEEEKIFSKIIRDADKVDIIYQASEKLNINAEDEEEIKKSYIDDETMKQIRENKQILRGKESNKLKQILTQVAFIFDINNIYCLKLIKNKDYINKILNYILTEDENRKKQIEEIRNISSNYINSKINKES